MSSGPAEQALASARALLREGNAALALEQVQELEKTWQDQPAVTFYKGHILRRLGRHAEAAPLLAMSVRQTPDFAIAHQELGLSLYALRRLTEAKRALRKAVALDKSLALPWRLLAEIYAIEGQADESQDAARRHLLAISRHPLFIKAVELTNEGKLGLAEGICRDYLLRYPDDVNAIRLLAEIGIKLGMFRDAERLLERCLELAPDFHLARNHYANVLAKTNQFERALREIRRLEQADPDNLSHPVLAASILVDVGEFDAAIERYERILKQVPTHSRLQMSMGHALKTVGRNSQSIAAYRRAIEAEPNLGEAYWSLANLKTFRLAAEDIAAMKKALDKPTLDASDAFHFCFALGKALEDEGQYDESFAYYEMGNEIKIRLSGYEASANTARLDRIRSKCTRELFGSCRNAGHAAADPIFIVGLPRSGSTLLEQILSSHSQVEGTMELPYIGQCVRRLGGIDAKADESKYPDVLHTLAPERFRELGQEYLDAAQIHRRGKRYFIDKMPNNFAHVGLIHLMLPNAKIIDARRHPMATCFSCFKQLFAAGQVFTYGLENIGRYYRDYVAVMDHWNDVLPGKVLLIEYERVVDDFETRVRRLLDFCGLEFEPACLRFFESERAVRTASSEQVRRPIYREALEQWRHYDRHLEPLWTALGPCAAQ